MSKNNIFKRNTYIIVNKFNTFYSGFDDTTTKPLLKVQYPEDSFIDVMAMGKLVVKDQEGHLLAGTLEGLMAEIIKVGHYTFRICMMFVKHKNLAQNH